MSRYRTVHSQADVDRWIAQGFGQGQGKDYKSWIRGHHFGSKGRCHRLMSTKTGRIQDTFSDVERNWCILLDFDDDVVETREQFALLPQTSAMEIARRLRIQYPLYPGTDVPFVLSLDFFITLRPVGGRLRYAARSVKMSSDLSDKRVLDKLTLERVFCEERGWQWKLLTERNLPKILLRNVNWLRQGYTLPSHLKTSEVQLAFLVVFQKRGRIGSELRFEKQDTLTPGM